MHKASFLAAVAVMLFLSGCGFASGPSSNSFEMDVTTTAVRAQDLTVTPVNATYKAMTVVNTSATPLLVGGPQTRALRVCSDVAARCAGTSFTALSGNVWLESTSGTISDVQLMPVGD